MTSSYATYLALVIAVVFVIGVIVVAVIVIGVNSIRVIVKALNNAYGSNSDDAHSKDSSDDRQHHEGDGLES